MKPTVHVNKHVLKKPPVGFFFHLLKIVYLVGGGC